MCGAAAAYRRELKASAQADAQEGPSSAAAEESEADSERRTFFFEGIWIDAELINDEGAMGQVYASELTLKGCMRAKVK